MLVLSSVFLFLSFCSSHFVFSLWCFSSPYSSLCLYDWLGSRGTSFLFLASCRPEGLTCFFFMTQFPINMYKSCYKYWEKASLTKEGSCMLSTPFASYDPWQQDLFSSLSSWRQMVASPMSSAPTSLSYIALVTWGTLTWKPPWQRKEQVIPSRQAETAKVVQSRRRVGDSLCLLSTRMSPWGRSFLQAQWHLQANSADALCRTKCVFSWLWACLPGLQFTAAQVISITRVVSTIQFENMDRHFRRGIPYFGQVSKSLEGLCWRWLTGSHITAMMTAPRGLLGVGLFSSLLICNALLIILNTEDYSFILSLILPATLEIRTIH